MMLVRVANMSDSRKYVHAKAVVPVEGEGSAIKGLLILAVCIAYSTVMFAAFGLVQFVLPNLLVKLNKCINPPPENRQGEKKVKFAPLPSRASSTLLSRQG